MTDRLDRALGALDAHELERVCLEITGIPSPSGQELGVATWLRDYLVDGGVDARLQHVDPGQANVVATLRGEAPGPSLLLYAPMDTAFSGDDEEDAPWLGEHRRADFSTEATIVDGHVVGLGAENPKAFATCVVAAAKALAAAGGPGRGEVIIGLGSGGMPITARPGIERASLGFGSGITHMLQRGYRPDYAVVAKPGYAVQTDEVGTCWFRIDVFGTLNYTGIRQIIPYRNAIVDAARIVVALEEFYASYSARHTGPALSPQGSTGAIVAGEGGRTAFVPGRCSVFIDLRTAPESTPHQVAEELEVFLGEFCAEHDITYRTTMLVSVPGGRSDPESRLANAAVRAWEAVEGEPHQERTNMSGVSDAAVLRGMGIETVVVGVPREHKPPQFAGFSMGVVSQTSMMRLAEILVRTALDVCGETGA